MKSIRVEKPGAPEELMVQEVPLPEPGPGQIRIKVMAAGVNPVDTYIRAGLYPWNHYPYTPGFDAAGIVDQCGSQVSGFSIGQRVYTAGNITGAYAQYMLCEPAQVYSLPDSVSFEQGAAMHIPYATAHRSLFNKAQAQEGQWVLIHGATGGVGLAAIQIARGAGLKIIATGGTPAGLKLLKDQGCDAVLDHGKEGYLSEVPTLTGGAGADIILEMLANVNLDRDLDVLARNGTIVIIGCRGRVEIEPRKMMKLDARVMGILLFNTPDDEMSGIHRDLVEGLRKGSLVPVIGKTYTLEKAPQSHVEILQPGTFGKRILLPWE